MTLSCQILIFLACLFSFSLTQTINQTTIQTTTTTILTSSPRLYVPICRAGVRFLTADIATNYLLQAGANATNLLGQNSSRCDEPRLMRTVTGSFKECNCPLIDHCVRIDKKNAAQYLNPCFAKCQHGDTGYGDYKRCDHKFLLTSQPSVQSSSSSSSSTNRIVTSNLYKNQTCPQCSIFGYSPVCINQVEFSNLCYAQCIQPNTTVTSCVVSYAMTQTSQNPSNCVCIGEVVPVCVNERRYMNECLAQCDFPGVATTSC